ncbi:MAG: sigma 54-interacting transcriptional regulator [Deinococcota bacterium]|jgi:magnesium chelatase subunit I|nr:sigma 54-interacting transcriptional regulator [Deinococcota bacterium]
MKASTLGDLRQTPWQAKAGRSIKQELRDNLICRLKENRPVFPGIVGYDDSVVPQVVNAVLSKHNFILLGLRGQAKTRILRQLTELLDDEVPFIKGTETHDDPFHPLSAEGRRIVAAEGDGTPIGWLPKEARYVEKLATPDVTVADIVGDIDPIKAAKLGTRISDELSVHYGLLPRANRGIFAMNELPDLSGKVQVALFNIMQEGDVQIKGYPIRLNLDVLLVFSANPEDYTARGKIVTPLKDRIGSEIRTHYPATVEEGMAITRQEAWISRGREVKVPSFMAEVVEEVAFQARDDSRVDKHSGVSQRLPISLLENVVSSAERRAILLREDVPIARIADLYSALSAVTGKLELEYEGELKGGEAVARDIARRAVGNVFGRRGSGLVLESIVEYFEGDNYLKVPDNITTAELPGVVNRVPGLLDAARELAEGRGKDDLGASAEFVLEGLYARKQIARSEERGYSAPEPEATQMPRRKWN